MALRKIVYLHIGTEKTGTTSIQAFLQQNRAALRALGYLVPQTAGTGNHTGLAVHSAKYPRVRDVARAMGLASQEDVDAWRGDFAARLHREIETFEGHAVVLSNEHCWSRLLFAEPIKALKALLEPVAEDIRILVYFRPQHALLWSSYSTMLKSGSTASFAIPPREKRRQYHYFAVLNQWAEVFGKSALHPRTYERERLRGGGLQRELCEFLGVDPAAEWKAAPAANRQLDPLHQEFLRRFNAHVPYLGDHGVNRLRSNLVQILEARSHRDPAAAVTPLAAPALQAFYADFRSGNASLARHYFGRSDGRLFSGEEETAAGEPPVVPYPLSVDEAVEVAAALWTGLQARIGRGKPSGAGGKPG